MKKLPFVFLITMPILQIVLAALKLFGVFGEDVIVTRIFYFEECTVRA